MIVYMNSTVATILSIPIILYIFYNLFFLKDKNYLKYIFIGILTVYVLGLFNYAIFPIYINSSIAKEIHKSQTVIENILENLNLVPFVKDFYFKDFILNIIMTFPMGSLLPCIFKCINKNQVLAFGLILGLFLEIIQLFLAFLQGFTFRNININDSIANFLGVFFGYCISDLIIKIFIIKFKDSNNRLFINLVNYFS